jgi:hypothetical protein
MSLAPGMTVGWKHTYGEIRSNSRNHGLIGQWQMSF